MIHLESTHVDTLTSDDLHNISIKSLKKLEQSFVINMKKNNIDMPLEFSRAVDDNFWDLL